MCNARFASILLALLVSPALAHGGTYLGRESAGTPTFGGPACGPSRAGTPAFCGPSRAPTLGPGGTPAACGPSRGPRITRCDDDPRLRWDWWWEHNAAQYLNVKAAVHKNWDLGETCWPESRNALSPSKLTVLTVNQIRHAALPIVRLGMTDPFFDTRAGAVIAAGKIADPANPTKGELTQEMRKLLADPDKVTRESACLGLGLLGDKSQVPDLMLIFKNDPKARESANVTRKDILPRQRAFAALAIGLIGMQDDVDPAVIADLVDALNKEDPHPDLQVFPALALGMMRSQAAVPELRAVAANVEADEIVRAHAIIALAKLGDKSLVR